MFDYFQHNINIPVHLNVFPITFFAITFKKISVTLSPFSILDASYSFSQDYFEEFQKSLISVILIFLTSYYDIYGSSPFSGVSSLFTGVSDIFTSLFRRASLFPGVSPKLLIILVSTRFFWSSSLFSGVLYSCHQIFLKLHQLSLKLPITFIAMLDASIVVLNFQCYDWFATKNINLKEV